MLVSMSQSRIRRSSDSGKKSVMSLPPEWGHTGRNIPDPTGGDRATSLDGDHQPQWESQGGCGHVPATIP